MGDYYLTLTDDTVSSWATSTGDADVFYIADTEPGAGQFSALVPSRTTAGPAVAKWTTDDEARDLSQHSGDYGFTLDAAEANASLVFGATVHATNTARTGEADITSSGAGAFTGTGLHTHSAPATPAPTGYIGLSLTAGNDDMMADHTLTLDLATSTVLVPWAITTAPPETLPVTAAGTGQTTGAAALSVVGPATTYPMTAAGVGQTAGDAAVAIALRVYSLTSSGAGQTAGAVEFAGSLALEAAGAAQTQGAATVSRATTVSAATAGQTAGSAGLSLTATLEAHGTGQTAGTATPGILGGSTTYALTVSGAATTSGAAAVTRHTTLAASGHTQSQGSAAAGVVAPDAIGAGGHTQTAGQAAITRITTLAASSSASSSGIATLTATRLVSAAALAQSAGEATLAVLLDLTATGSAATAGSADLRPPATGQDVTVHASLDPRVWAALLEPRRDLEAHVAARRKLAATVVRTRTATTEPRTWEAQL